MCLAVILAICKLRTDPELTGTLLAQAFLH
jgi:hypothetical protein